MKLGLIALFALTALLYASVGFGGGSTYTALLVLVGTDFLILPIIALTCNIVVVTGGCWRFHREGVLRARALTPFLITSIPAAWFGGRLPVSETVFIGLLGGALLFAGIRMLFVQSSMAVSQEPHSLSPIVAGLIGASLGGLAGIVGIGGGIFLAPILYAIRWGTEREIAGACSLFILLNSLSGLVGQLQKLGQAGTLDLLIPYLPLVAAVLIGGQIGSWLGAKRLNPHWIKRLTAILILYVAARLLLRFASLI
ncbi:MAG: sulfite exporter TauE/SafE family protein [Pseudomonadota bacterium]